MSEHSHCIPRRAKKISELGVSARKFAESLDFISNSGLAKYGVEVNYDSPTYNDPTVLVDFPRKYKGVDFLDERIGYAFDKVLNSLKILQIIADVTLAPILDQEGKFPKNEIPEIVIQACRKSSAVEAIFSMSKSDLKILDTNLVAIGRLLYVHENNRLSHLEANEIDILDKPLHLCYQCAVNAPGARPIRVYVDAISGKVVGADFPF